MSRRLLQPGALVLALGLGALAAASGSAAPRNGFSARVDNPWFPLRPGSRYVYTGVKDGTQAPSGLNSGFGEHRAPPF